MSWLLLKNRSLTPATCSKSKSYSRVTVHASKNKLDKVRDQYETAILNATRICKKDEQFHEYSTACIIAWDIVFDIEKSYNRLLNEVHDAISDPLDSYCESNKNAEECKEYDE